MKLFFAAAAALFAGDWTAPVEIRSDEDVVIRYRAKLDGGHLLIQAKLKPGWHTFAMDNKIRADEKLAGRKALGADRPTSFELSGGLKTAGGWKQTEPKDFSKQELRIFTWGFENEALFAVPVTRSGGEAKIGIRAQACTEAICKEINTSLPVPVDGQTAAVENIANLAEVRTR